MSAVRILGGFVLGFAMMLGAFSGATSGPVALALRSALTQVRALAQDDGKAEVAIAFDGDGRIASSRVRRSTGSERSDAAALDGALELASLEQPRLVAGRTLVFRTDVGARAGSPTD